MWGSSTAKMEQLQIFIGFSRVSFAEATDQRRWATATATTATEITIILESGTRLFLEGRLLNVARGTELELETIA